MCVVMLQMSAMGRAAAIPRCEYIFANIFDISGGFSLYLFHEYRMRLGIVRV